jgi:hypothetical protein
MSELSRTQAHAARALADQCPYCGKTACPDRAEHDRWDAANEATWWRNSIRPSPLLQRGKVITGSPLLDQTALHERGQR